jgi:hypothetical protein
MIDISLKFLADELNKFLSLKIGIHTDARLVLGNVFKAIDGDGSGQNNLSSKAILSLVNVEEDRVAKIQENYTKTFDGVIYKSPPVLLNLYILISIGPGVAYNDGLKWLSYFIQFFQYKNVFMPESHPSLDVKIKKLIVDLYSMNFEQINHLWSTLGGKYLPSVLYKVRQITIDEEAPEFTSGFIKEIQFSEKSKQPIF